MSAPKKYELDDGSYITAGQLAYRIKTTINKAICMLRNSSNLEELLSGTVPDERLYRRGNESYTATEVQKKTGNDARSVAVYRCNRWEAGEISTSELLYKGRMPRVAKKAQPDNYLNKGNAEWQALGSEPRGLALAKIKGAGRWEVERL